MKALIIEDSSEIAEAISLCLQLRWSEISLATAADGLKSLEMLATAAFDIVILDINLPDIDGFEVLRRLRSFSNVAVIIITVRGSSEDQVKGLEMGADDYIVKPFNPRDLVARVNSVFRRSSIAGGSQEEARLVRGKLTLNLTSNEVQLGQETMKITPVEYRLLYILMKNSEVTLTNEEIIWQVWGEKYTNTDLLRTCVRRLRAKLHDDPPQIILNQRGEGYRFVSPT